MANFSFPKHSRGEKLKFFQSSLPYLRNKGLSPKSTGTSRRWSSEEPRATSSGFLTFKNGHYGIYFTLFNHELRKQEQDGTHFAHGSIIFISSGTQSLVTLSEFFISKAKQDTHNDVNWLKTVATNLLSTASLVKSRYMIRHLYHTRGFCTSTKQSKDKSSNRQPQPRYENRTNVVLEDSKRAVDNASCGVEGHEQPFEESFYESQISKIMDVSHNYTTPDELNVIYPIYQSLKRNNILLANIELYNIILKSITMRSLDSALSLQDLESRLTCLLTVYQDILSACHANPRCHPSTETYRIVLDAIFKGSKQLLTQQIAGSLPSHSLDNLMFKCQEFCQVGINLYTSLPEHARTSLYCILPDMLYCLKLFPGLLNEVLASSLVQLRDYNTDNAQFYVNLISLTGTLSKFDHLCLDKKGSYGFVSDVFNAYKRNTVTSPFMANAEYEVYSALLKSLVVTGNIPIATKFLDQVMETYKKDLLSNEISMFSTESLSNLISDYLRALLESEDSENLERAYNLVHSMREVTYLPDMNISIYNDMIYRYIFQYKKQEDLKVSSEDCIEANRLQKLIYRKVWGLYDYITIRNDFAHFSSTCSDKPSCIEVLLSFSIDLGDTSRISRLIKEVMSKNIHIKNQGISRKLCQYLSNETYMNSEHHYRVLWAYLEQQADHLYHDPALIHDFLSEHVLYVVRNDQKAASFILNSRLVKHAFDTVSISTHNLHGASVVISYLQNMCKQITFTELEQTKTLLYQAQLLNEFEDTENHYLEMSSEMISFLADLKMSFTTLLSSAKSNMLTAPVCLACSALGIEVGEHAEYFLQPAHYEIDLLPHFSVSGQHGTELFLESFSSGYNFNFETWKAIFNRSFAMTVLEKHRPLSVSDALERLFRLENEMHIKQLMKCLISLHNDKVNIELFKYLLKGRHEEILASREILDSLARFASQTTNQYFLTLFSQNFIEITQLNSDKAWMYPIFERLNEVGRFNDVDSLVSQNFELFNRGLNISHKPDELFLKSVLNAFMKTSNLEKVNEVFKYHFSGPEKQKLLVSSGDLFACLLEYYTYAGSHEIVLQHYKKLALADSRAKQSVQFANLISTLEGQTQNHGLTNEDTIESFSLSLLSETNVLGMQKLYKANQHLVANNEQLLNILMNDLTKAVKCLSEAGRATVVARFESVIKFCRVLRLQSISAKTVKSIVNFLALSGSKNLLNILFAKFMINDTLLLSFNFYFLKVELKSKAELDEVLLEFENGFKFIGDAINLQAIEGFKARC